MLKKMDIKTHKATITLRKNDDSVQASKKDEGRDSSTVVHQQTTEVSSGTMDASRKSPDEGVCPSSRISLHE